MSCSYIAQKYLSSSRAILSTIAVVNSPIAWSRAIEAFELCSKAIEADPSSADAYFGRAACSQLFMNMIVAGSQVIKEYSDKHISLDKKNTFIEDLINAEKLGSHEAKMILQNDPAISKLKAIYSRRNS